MGHVVSLRSGLTFFAAHTRPRHRGTLQGPQSNPGGRGHKRFLRWLREDWGKCWRAGASDVGGLFVEGGRGLEHAGDAEELGFVPGGADELETDGESFPAFENEAGGYGDAGEAGEVDADGVDVLEPHGEGVCGFFAEFEGGVRGGGHEDGVAAGFFRAEGRVE